MTSHNRVIPATARPTRYPPEFPPNSLNLTYSRFRPTFPALRSPTMPTAPVSNILANPSQNVTRYPSISADGESLFGLPDSLVTFEATTAMMAMPREVPNWATVLKTAPASAWVLAGKTSTIIKLEIVKRTAGCTLAGAAFCLVETNKRRGAYRRLIRGREPWTKRLRTSRTIWD